MHHLVCIVLMCAAVLVVSLEPQQQCGSAVWPAAKHVWQFGQPHRGRFCGSSHVDGSLLMLYANSSFISERLPSLNGSAFTVEVWARIEVMTRPGLLVSVRDRSSTSHDALATFRGKRVHWFAGNSYSERIGEWSRKLNYDLLINWSLFSGTCVRQGSYTQAKFNRMQMGSPMPY